MLARHIKYSSAQRELASAARATAMNRDVLYHGTRYAQRILKTGTLLRAESHTGEKKVSFTRSPEVAAFWASVRRADDEGRGAVFVIDRNSLERAHKIEAVAGPYWHTKRVFHDEAKEQIGHDVTDLARHLIGFVVETAPLKLAAKQRRLSNKLTIKKLEIALMRQSLNDHYRFFLRQFQAAARAEQKGWP